MKSTLFALILILGHFVSFAGKEKYMNYLSSSSVIEDAFYETNDAKFSMMQALPNWELLFTNHVVKNRVVLEYDKNNPQVYTGNFTVDVELFIEYTDEDMVNHTTTEILTLDYLADPAQTINDRSSFLFEGGHYVKVTIVSISGTGTLPTNLQVRTEIEVERYYTFDHTDVASNFGYNYTTGDNHLELYWDPIEGAEEYDLEWVYVNDYTATPSVYKTAATIPYNYYRNSTRITTPNTNYKVPVIFDHGYVVFRVRAVSRQGTDYTYKYYGDWSAPESGTVLSHPAAQIVPITTEYESGNINWTYVVSYTESGNRKEQVSFGDGLGRQRQSVVYNPVTGQAIVSNLYYDYHGRVAVTDLPTPVVDGELVFYPEFNQNGDNEVFNAENFDLDYEGPTCPVVQDPMITTEGAGQYYSTNNPDVEGAQAYVPDAEGYPFARIEYTPDHTGRIRSASGYGADFQLGSGHEVTYTYASATEDEIKNLFGVEGGEIGLVHSKYSKTVMTDANGQVYVTYYDFHGRVIATGLVGPTPDGIDALDNNAGATPYVTTLYEGTASQEVYFGGAEINSTFTVDIAGETSFSYFIDPEIFEDECMGELCFDCVYDLEITITTIDECGDLITVVNETHTVNGLPVDGLCNEEAEFEIESSEMLVELEAGLYFLSKKLTVNEQAREDYLCMYLEENTCLMTFQDFFNENFSEETFTDCATPDVPLFGTSGSYCDAFENMLLADVSYGGQYGFYDFDPLTNTYSASAYPLSVFNSSNSLPVSGADWTNPVTPYLNSDGSTSYVIVAGVPTVPENLTLTQFLSNWQISWAQSLLPYHPEYAYLEFCEDNAASHAFDEDLNETSLFADACSAGYFDPLGQLNPATYFPTSSIDVYNSCDVTPNTTVTDPFFASGDGVPYLNAMRGKMDLYATIDGLDLNIWELAVLMAAGCSDMEDAAAISLCIRDYDGGDCMEDQVWKNFRSLYLTAKLQYYQIAELDYVMDNGSYNGCIGETTFDETINDFDCYPITQSPACSTNSSNYDGYADANQACYVATYGYYDESVRRFPIYDETNFDVLTVGDMATLESIAEAEMDEICEETCEENAAFWMAQLSGCEMTSPEAEDIQEELVELCILGCDFANPDGASTLPTGVTTTNGNASFHEVLEYHLGSGWENEVCSDLLIAEPRPYGQGPETLLGTLDECGCDLILQADYDFTTAPGSYTSMEELFLATNGFSVEGLSSLACICTKAYEVSEEEWIPTDIVWTGSALAHLEEQDIKVPYQLTCEECEDCESIGLLVVDFLEIFDEVDDFEETPTYPILLANYLNNALNYHLSPDEYIEFLEACNADETAPYCTTSAQMLSLVPVLDLLVKQDKFLSVSAGPIDLMTENVPYPYTPFGQGLTNHDYWTNYSGTSCSGGTLTMYFGSAMDNCTITLTLPAGADFCFEDIIAVYSLEALTEDCGANNDFKLEIGYVSCNGILTAELTGESTCYDVTTCQCDGILTLCDDPLPTGNFNEDCYSYTINVITANAMEEYEVYMAAQKDLFRQQYTLKCMEAFETEKLDMVGVKNEYQYTLFYYDQAGNLVRTVAPKGVELDGGMETNPGGGLVPAHKYDTDYRYNTYNQITNSNTPDGGVVNYWYDEFGRLVASQNAEQAPLQYAYMLFDEHGRIQEMGLTEQGIGDELNETIAKDNNSFVTWVALGTQTEMTRTWYDLPVHASVSAAFDGGVQTNLRLRIATVAYYETEVGDYTTQYTSAVHYSYDVHGNVKESIQDVPLMAPVEQDKKSTQYEYDLISGNVKKVTYQKDAADQFIHIYEYDAMDRLHETFTSANGIDFDKEVKQFYYDHGPLARIEIGEDKVQGLDYTYTINGWLKGTNAATLVRANDLGLDGIIASGGGYAGLHGNVARDVFGFTLSYYEGDYAAIDGSSFEATTASTDFGNAAANLYNGNIRYMTTAIEGFDIHGYAYTYDQLQRFKNMDVYSGIDVVNNTWSGATFTNDYHMEMWYDENGNITFMNRNGYGSELDMDEFTYLYTSLTNQLTHVTDNGTDYGGYDDIKTGMSSGNYQYDDIGRLTEDGSEGISAIEWRNSDNKVREVTTAGDDVEFVYDPFGNRVLKIVKPDLMTPADWIYTYYVHDASGNTMAVYNSLLQSTTKETKLTEQHIYGAKRLGMKTDELTLFFNTEVVFTPSDIVENKRGEKSYELSNHLGDVLAVVSDRSTYEEIALSDYGFVAYVQSKTDYYPFGMVMPGRIDNGVYRYGFQGQEKDDEIKGDGNSVNYKYRMHDPRIGRFFAVDPLAPKYPHNSPYAFSENRVIDGFELEGLEWVDANAIIAEYGVDEFGPQRGIADPGDPEWVQEFFDWCYEGSIEVWNGYDLETKMVKARYKIYTSVITETYRPTMNTIAMMYTGLALLGGNAASAPRIAYSSMQKTITSVDVTNGVVEVTATQSRMGGRAVIVDQNLSPALVSQLEAEGFSVVRFADGTSDDAIITWAKENGAIVMTNNVRHFKNQGITTIKVGARLSRSGNTGEVVNKMITLSQTAAKNSGTISPGKHISLPEIQGAVTP